MGSARSSSLEKAWRVSRALTARSQKAIVRGRGAPFARPDEQFGDLGRQGHGRVADPLCKIDGEAPFAGVGGSNRGADATLDGGFDNHAPHQKTEFLDAMPRLRR